MSGKFLPVLLGTGIFITVQTGCIRVKSDPVEVKPIEININVRVKVDRELDNFFNDLDARDASKKAGN